MRKTPAVLTDGNKDDGEVHEHGILEDAFARQADDGSLDHPDMDRADAWRDGCDGLEWCAGSCEKAVRTATPATFGRDGQTGRDEQAPPSVVSVEAAASSPESAVKPSDYPPPQALQDGGNVTLWDEEFDPVDNYRRLGAALAGSGDLYRAAGYASGLLLASMAAGAPTTPITTASKLACVLVDRIRVRTIKGGKEQGVVVPRRHLADMLGSEAFLQAFPVADAVLTSPLYDSDFVLAKPGYNDGPPGRRVLYTGPPAPIANSTEAMDAFLAVMDFASSADRTNAVAAALTVLLRNHWPGGKPILLATATKSHSGKDTVLLFAAGSASSQSISYQRTNWALEEAIVGVLQRSPDLGLLVVENARLGPGEAFLASACLERMATAPELCLHSSKQRDSWVRPNDLVLALSTNDGAISEDIANRALPIHLAPCGDVHRRASPIGNPKYEYLPAQRERMQAELRGMVERWRAAGRPLDETVQHPMTLWAQTIGGILRHAGYQDFLANFGQRKSSADPLRRALGLVGAARPGEWLRSQEWVRLVIELGLAQDLVPAADRRSEAGRQRGVGVVFSAHDKEIFTVETEDETVVLRLRKARRRWRPGEQPQMRYQFEVLERTALPEDPPPSDPVAADPAA